MDIQLEVDDATQYATAYLGIKPIATLQRRRIMDTGPRWKIYNLNGELIGTSNYKNPLRKIIAAHYNNIEAKQEA